MSYNPQIHDRKSIRYKGYDYAQAGLYFITICVQNRKCLFGEIRKGEMVLNDAGKMIATWYHELENKFHDIRCHEMIIMPDHFHCIVELVGADLRVCPVNQITNEISQNTTVEKTGANQPILANQPTFCEQSTMGQPTDFGRTINNGRTNQFG